MDRRELCIGSDFLSIIFILSKPDNVLPAIENQESK